MPQSKLLQFILIFFFAASVVMLGAHDLTTKHLAQFEAGTRHTRSLVKELYGPSNMEAPRASISDQALEQALTQPDDQAEPAKQEKHYFRDLLRRIWP